MFVSIIIPAYNAAETITDTLDSLLAQTHSNWEAIVIDDGSDDTTVTVAETYVERDPRIHLICQSHSGACVARNVGIASARYDWLLFLDADDWLLTQHLERLTAFLAAHPALDAVHCGWTRVAPNGELGREHFAPDVVDLFPEFARYCAFQPNACLVRRSIVEAVGGFDASFRSCQDWDLWQRVARTGAEFGAVHEVLARYRSRPGSISLDGARIHADGLRVISQGHAPDPRVPNPKPEYADGLPKTHLSNVKLNFACWTGALLIGAGQDTAFLFDSLEDVTDPDLNPFHVADSIFKALLLPVGLPVSGWYDVWPRVHKRLVQFLDQLERQSGAFDLKARTLRHLERSILDQAEISLPTTLGFTHALLLEITAPLPDIVPPTPVEQLLVNVEVEGTGLGSVALPVSNGFVSGQAIADAVATAYAWQILGRFFEQTLYPQLQVEKGPSHQSIWRGKLCLATMPVTCQENFWSQFHDDVGWTIFLQELWARPDWPERYFYDAEMVEAPASHGCSPSSSTAVEVSEALPDFCLAGSQLDVRVTVGGAPLGQTSVPVSENRIPAHNVRVAITAFGGFDLCRLAVREGLLGRPLNESPSLRARLKAAAKQHQAR